MLTVLTMLSVSWMNEDGDEQTVQGESLEALSFAMHEQGYRGPTRPVEDPAGFIKGWVSNQEWRYA